MEKLENIELIRVATAGSVDDGKSTMIGRLLYDCNAVPEDQIAAVENLRKRKGEAEIDLSLFTDGLLAEREQKITIDVAYRYFSLGKRRFIIADVPGHEQYTKNMVTGASNSDLVLVLIDIRNGITIQSKRHLFIASLLGIPHVAIIVNKMDEVNFSEAKFEKIKNSFLDYASRLNVSDLQFIPISALKGDMVVDRGSKMDWYKGPTLLDYLSDVQIISNRNLVDFRLPVQMVVRPHQNFRGYAGQVESGIIRKGQAVKILPSGRSAKISKLFLSGEPAQEAFAGQQVILSLDKEIDASRGDVICREGNLPEAGHNIEAAISWFSEKPIKEGGSYFLKMGPKETRCHIEKIKYKINVSSLKRQFPRQLEFNDVGRIFLRTNDELVFDAFSKNRPLGNFILIDEVTNETAGAGVIIGKSKETGKEGKKKGAVLWFTGLSGSGKSTIADKLFEELKKWDIQCERMDGDNLREQLTGHLGFSKEGRDRNIQIAGYLAGMLSRHNVLVLATFISPYKKHRKLARAQAQNFIEIFVDAPLAICEKRDPKGLYKKARKGEIEMFTGVHDKYEAPSKPEIRLKTNELSLDESVKKIIDYLKKNCLI